MLRLDDKGVAARCGCVEGKEFFGRRDFSRHLLSG